MNNSIHIVASVQMGYMRVEEHSFNLLHLKRSPGIRSWSLLVGKCVRSQMFIQSIHSLDKYIGRLEIGPVILDFICIKKIIG